MTTALHDHAALARIAQIVRDRVGLSFGDEKRLLLESRIDRLLGEGWARSAAELAERVERGDPALSDALDAAVTTHHTYFWREPEHFTHLVDVALPERIAARTAERGLRVWCAASSTGQEAYTLAAATELVLGDASERWDLRMLATDVSTEVLATAADGRYAREDVAHLPATWARAMFEPPADERPRIRAGLRERVLFRWLNLVEPEWRVRGDLDVVFCRNVTMYFDEPTRRAVLGRLHARLAPGGWLYLGLTEALLDGSGLFTTVAPGIHRRNDDPGLEVGMGSSDHGHEERSQS